MANLTTVTYASGSLANTTTGSVSTVDALMADGGQATIGAKADVVYSDGTGAAAGSLTAILKGLFVKLAGTLTVATHAVTQSGTWTVQPGNTANTTPWLAKVGDGTNAVAIKAASTAPAATDPALVVALSPNGLNANGQTTMSASAPMAIASDQTIINKAVTQSSGVTDSRVNAAATTNATSLKASAGNIFSIDVFNAAAYDVFLKLYNKASAPTVGTDTPVFTIVLKTGTGYSRDFPRGRNFATGIAYAITKLQADSDTTAVAAGDVTGTIGWI